MRPIELSFILAALSLTLVACRSSPAPSTAASSTKEQPTPDLSALPLQAPDPAPADVSRRDGRPLIVCFGDSLTAGYGAEPGQSYPDFLQRDLDRRGFHYRVVNEGISGNTTKDGLERVDRVVALHPAVVIVEFGGNDGLRGVPIRDSRANLDKILARLQPTGAKLMLAGITLPPDYGPDYVQQFNETYALLAHKYHIALLPFLLQSVYGLPGMIQADRIHPTAKGNEVVASNLLPLLSPMLKKP